MKNKLRLHKSMVPEDLNIKDILKSGMVSNYKYVKRLEKKLKRIHKVKYAICFGSGTQAIMALLYVLKPKTIAMPSFTWTSAKLAVNMMKIKKYYLDMSIIEYVVEEMEQKIMEREKKPDMFFLTSTFGNKPYVVYPEKTILDSAHCAGHKGFGNLALAEILSFAPSKTFTGIEGGAIITNEESLFLKLKEIQHIFSRMGEINAKVALYNLNRRNKIFRWKKFLFRKYKKELGRWRFQYIPHYSTLNEITAIFPEFDKEDWEELGKKMEIRKRYDPKEFNSKCKKSEQSYILYENIMTLPSYIGADYEKAIKIIKDLLRKKRC